MSDFSVTDAIDQIGTQHAQAMRGFPGCWEQLSEDDRRQFMIESAAAYRRYTAETAGNLREVAEGLTVQAFALECGGEYTEMIMLTAAGITPAPPHVTVSVNRKDIPES